MSSDRDILCLHFFFIALSGSYDIPDQIDRESLSLQDYLHIFFQLENTYLLPSPLLSFSSVLTFNCIGLKQNHRIKLNQ